MNDALSLAPSDLGMDNWIDIWVFLDPAKVTLEVATPKTPIAVGQPVRWRFRTRRANGESGPLPAGWAPMLSFPPQGVSDSSPFGPFVSLLQVAQEHEEGVLIDLIGEWPATSVTPAAKDFPYFAILHRGLGFGNLKSFSLLGSGSVSLKMGEKADRPYLRPEAPDEHRADFEVTRDPADEHRLAIAPCTPVKVFTNSTVTWRFPGDFHRCYPFILFYHSVEMKSATTDDAGAVVIEEGSENEHFEPCQKMRLSLEGVEAWDFKSERRHCFYEAAASSQRLLSVQFISTGDPQIDNEGIPFPTVDLPPGDG